MKTLVKKGFLTLVIITSYTISFAQEKQDSAARDTAITQRQKTSPAKIDKDKEAVKKIDSSANKSKMPVVKPKDQSKDMPNPYNKRK
jgi:hypothetical protein